MTTGAASLVVLTRNDSPCFNLFCHTVATNVRLRRCRQGGVQQPEEQEIARAAAGPHSHAGRQQCGQCCQCSGAQGKQ